MDNEHILQLEVKIRALMAVLKVALAKIDIAREKGCADIERLNRIRENLSKTLSLCERAQIELEKRIAEIGADIVDIEPLPTDLPAITMEEIVNTDIHELSRQLGNL